MESEQDEGQEEQEVGQGVLIMNELEKYAAKRKLASALMEKEAFVGAALRLGMKGAGAIATKARGLARKVKQLPTRLRRSFSPSFKRKQDQQMMKLRGGSGNFKPENPAELEKVRNYLAAGGNRSVPKRDMVSMYRQQQLGRRNAKAMLPSAKGIVGKRIPLGLNQGAQRAEDYNKTMSKIRSNTAKSLTKALGK